MAGVQHRVVEMQYRNAARCQYQAKQRVFMPITAQLLIEGKAGKNFGS